MLTLISKMETSTTKKGGFIEKINNFLMSFKMTQLFQDSYIFSFPSKIIKMRGPRLKIVWSWSQPYQTFFLLFNA